ncbi:hypothetical protein AAC03nite_23520 [Alicyclobacillus acidoterrestris]|uniref:putative nucleotidyltransferase substrate binding domain-containing protein n=1 Tax=Alicyclobacillus suci TaxID=2816080 RepID=UPI001195ACB4|nr:putative nucleotidyltransferase substrate binding domain-containing protein [Alicyclobacillus suci]GEO26567.1 hypothetical protein AAC03nite_23520 [Alicyclobacillus acidoterrestris]
MLAFPQFDVNWLALPEGHHRRKEWVQAMAEVTLTWLNDGGSVDIWLKHYQLVRQYALQSAWVHYIPEQILPHLQYIRFGSGGRGEDSLYSDLDYAIVTTGRVNREDVFEALHRFVRGMVDFGFPPCQGFVMGTNPRWIGSIVDWKRRIEQYLNYPDWENVRYLCMMIDGCPLFNFEAWGSIASLAYEGIRNSPFICWEMAHLGIHNTVPLSRFGHVQTERIEDVEYFQIKEGLINPVVHAVRLLAIVYQVQHLNTRERFMALVTGGQLAEDLASRVQLALTYGWQLRLRTQATDVLRGTVPTDKIAWSTLTEAERTLTIQHLRAVRELERFVHRMFRKPR